MNRLARETSPYLRQHATNPVDWYPWGPEALERARGEDRPILLSIGYSACHWCHVMERESFDDPETAALINRSFVAIKVDREERPDVDAIYMRAVQALSGHGGWPLTVFLTPQGKPFFGGTYFPPEPRHRLPSFRQVLEKTAEAWLERRGEVEGAASEIGDILRRMNDHPVGVGGGARDIPPTATPAALLVSQSDPVHGGFGRAPKFPQPVVLEFLLRHHARTANDRVLEAVSLALDGMAEGGIRDHLGGGFHRYSVDERWLVPHFEKMLYDNALLAGVFLRAHQVTGRPEHAEVCREALADLLETFRSPDGAFYTAWDADSEGEEGRFYVWTPDEVCDALGEEEGGLFCRSYNVSAEGNFEGRSILHLPHGLDAVAGREGLVLDGLKERLAAARETLARVRDRRPAPLRDEKILASWNALTVRALAEVGAALDEPEFVEAGEAAAGWLLETLRPTDHLFHQWTDGQVAIPAFLDDVAGMGNAVLSLHEATLDHRWLEAAMALETEVERRFRDPDTGLLFDTPSDGEGLLIRPREITDNPIPSGTSFAAELSLRLGFLVGDDTRLERTRTLVRAASAGLERMPAAFGRLLSVADRLEGDPVEIVIVGPAVDPGTRALLREAHRPFLPNRIISGFDPEAGLPTHLANLPLFRGRTTRDGRPTAYVCRRFACAAPVSDPAELRAQLETTHG